MSSITKFILHQLRELKAKDIYGVKRIASGVFCYSKLTSAEIPDTCEEIFGLSFSHSKSLTTLTLPSSIKFIHANAFSDCTALANATLNLPADCVVYKNAFYGAPFYENATGNVLSTSGYVILKCTSTTLPESVTSIGGGVGSTLVTNSSLTFPDRIQVIGGGISGSPTKMVIGSSTKFLATESIPITVTTLICRQPSGMKVSLPKAGDGMGLTYDKNARNVAIYTDNEDIKNYNWSGDNVTATFYPLSKAPA